MYMSFQVYKTLSDENYHLNINKKNCSTPYLYFKVFLLYTCILYSKFK